MTAFFSRRSNHVLVLILIALLGGALVYHATARGPGIGGDATIYISSARNLLAGHGLGLVGPRVEFRLLPYFPPFFSLVLSGFGALGLDLVGAARWLNIFLFSGLILLAGAATSGALKRPGLAAALSLMLALSPVLVPVYSWAMSEPLAIFLGFLSLVFLSRYLEARQTGRDRSWGWVVLSALTSGLSFLTRYISIAFIGAALLTLLLLDPSRFHRRFGRAAIFSAVSLFPMLIWLAVDLTQTATVASRRLDFAGLADRLAGFWQDAGSTLLQWLIPESWVMGSPYPGSLNHYIVPVVIVIIITWGIWLSMRWRKDQRLVSGSRFRLLIILTLFSAVFLAAAILVKVTTYPPITINLRMLSPLHVAALWLIVIGLDLTLDILSDVNWLQRALYALLLLGLGWYGLRSINISIGLHRNGLGYTMPEWQESETMQAVRELPEDVIIITNQDMAVLALTGRAAYPLKEVYFDQPVEDFTRYGDGALENDEPQRLFREGKAVLVLFDTIDDQFAGLYGDRTAERIQGLVQGLHRQFRGDDGGIFYYEKR